MNACLSMWWNGKNNHNDYRSSSNNNNTNIHSTNIYYNNSNSSSTNSTPSMTRDTDTLLVFSLVSISTFIVIKLLQGVRAHDRPALPPSLPSIPYLGSFPFVSSTNELPKFYREISQRLGPVFGVTVGSEYAVILNTKDVIYEAFIRKAAAFSGRLPGYTAVHYLNPNGYGIVGKQYGDEFRRLHQLTLSILKEFGFGSRLMEDRIMVEVSELEVITRSHDAESFNPADLFSRCTINVIASIVFGRRVSQSDPIIDMLAENFRGFIQGKRRHIDHCPALRVLPRYRAALRDSVENQKKLMDFIDSHIDTSLNSDRESFVKRFVKREGETYNKEELKFIIRDLLIAGSETTSGTVQFAMIRMANHPKVQKRLQHEIDSIVNKTDHVTLDDMSHLPYVEASILEIMRIHPAVPLAIPHCTLHDTELAGYFIPKGTTVHPNIYSAHMDPCVFINPDEFLPERFLDENGRVKDRKLILTFSIGKRSCLGELLARQEIYLIISNLLHKFNILPPEGQQKVEVKENFLITLFPSPYQLRFVPREQITS